MRGPRFAWTHADAPASPIVTSALRQRGATNAAAVAALWHVEQHASRWNLERDERWRKVRCISRSARDLGEGAIVVKLGQRVDGVPVLADVAVGRDRISAT